MEVVSWGLVGSLGVGVVVVGVVGCVCFFFWWFFFVGGWFFGFGVVFLGWG